MTPVFVLLCVMAMAAPAPPAPLSQASPLQTATDPVMGDWQGHGGDPGSSGRQLCGQVVALGNNTYRANLIPVFNQRVVVLAALDGHLEAPAIAFQGKGANAYMAGFEVTGSIKDALFTGVVQSPKPAPFELKKVTLKSPSMGAQPPKGAVVLFDGRNLDQWVRAGAKPEEAAVPWLLLENGAIEVRAGSIISKKEFKDQRVHLEFCLPLMAAERGQARANSGVYLQGRYEVQILDSFGLEGKDDECGAIYKVAPPRMNACAPPLEWQTYDIVFRAPRFDTAGSKIRDANITVLQNGFMVQENQPIPGPTTAALDSRIAEAGGLYLQDHGCPVWFRNVWVQPLDRAKL